MVEPPTPDLTRRRSTGPVLGSAPAPAPARTVLPAKWVSILGLAGAAALLAALAVPFTPRSYEWNTWIILSPLEVGTVSLAAASIAFGLLRRRVDLSLAAGLLICFGLLTTVESISLARFADRVFESQGSWASILVVVGAIAILAAGWGCTRRVSIPAGGGIHPRAFTLGAAGVGLLSLSLFLPFDGQTSLVSEFGGRPEYVYGPVAAIAAAIVALVLAGSGSRPHFIAGMLLAIGAVSTLHYFGAMVAASKAWAQGEVQVGGLVGLLGAVLVTAAGILAYGASDAVPSPPSTE
jgi:hypothetical protein